MSDEVGSNGAAPGQGTPSAFAEQEVSLFDRATEMLQDGRLADAGDLLHQAAAEAVALDDAAAAIRLLQLSAATARTAGAPEEGRARAEYAVSLADEIHGDDPSLAVLALSEAAECALALQDTGSAADEFGQAAELPGVPDSVRTALLRRQAAALATAGRSKDARAALEAILVTGASSRNEEARVRVDLAGVAQQSGMPDRTQLVDRAAVAVEGLDDPDMDADVALLRSALAAERGDIAVAGQYAKEARERAIEAGSPVAFLAAVLSLAQFLDELDSEPDEIYATLADGWTVLSEMAGPEIAGAAFRNALEERQAQWGTEEFAAIEARYADRTSGPEPA